MSILIERPAILRSLDPSRHAVIEASAGTGKTYTLEHLIVDALLRDPSLRIEDILVVTFTERATAELKVRVRELLQKMLHDTRDIREEADHEGPMFGAETHGPESSHWLVTPADRARLERAFFAFDIAPIYTIHGFCQRVLTEYAFASQRSQDQQHVEFHVLFERAFDDAMRRTLSCHPDTREWLEAWLETSDVEELKMLLTRCLSNDFELWPRLREEELVGLIHEFAGDFWTTYQRLYTGRAGKRRRVIQRAERDYARTQSAARFLMMLDPEIVDIKHSLRDVTARSPRDERFIRLAVRLMRFKPALAQKFLPVMQQALAREKRRSNAYTYDDMLSLVWQSLSGTGGAWLTQTLRGRYKVALIDEFQDTDDVQWHIFRHLFFDSPQGNRLYLIGDPKQAIYGFRGADVHTYLKACNAVTRPVDPDQGAPGQMMRLEHNYRSSPDVVNAYNAILDQGAERPFFGGQDIRYDHPVVCAREQLQLVDAAGVPCSGMVVGSMRPRANAKVAMQDIYECYGRWIAREIRALLTEQGHVMLRDGDAEPRRLSARDIFVLTRTSSDERRLEEYLQEVGVPYARFKHEGLFQTQEAHELYVLLRAIDDPHDRGKRLKAWETPFFGVDMADLAQVRDMAESEPLYKKLIDWNHIARRQRFETLFTTVLQDSGLVRREIFFKDNERELTNYLHLMEVLLEEVCLGRLNLKQLVVRMSAFIEDKRKPIGDDGNVKRLESDRDAVQLMTLHKSKGLEAPIVFFYAFGGGGAEFWPFHYTDRQGQHVRAMHIHKPEARNSPKLRERVTQCVREEDERLFYVGLTRAQARVYVPYVPYENGELLCKYLNGRSFMVLNDRLTHMKEAAEQGQGTGHIQWEDIPYFGRHIPQPPQDADPEILATWQPPVEYMQGNTDPGGEEEVEALPSRRLSSYTSLKRRQGGYHAPSPPSEDELRAEDELGAAEDAIIGAHELPGGVRTGQCLHDIFEHVAFESFTKHQDEGSWREDPEVLALFERCMIQHGLDFDILPLCQRVIYRCLSAFIEVDHGVIYGLHSCLQNTREMAFLYPIPEAHHPRLSQEPEQGWVVDRGFIKGYIDFVFEWNGRVYFADWKSDVMARYEGQTLERHVDENYMIQVMLYATALCKMLGIHDEAAYEARFGEAIYCFLRGMTDDSHLGIIRRRPTWAELLAFEADMIKEEAS